jgi:hypothetical protein
VREEEDNDNDESQGKIKYELNDQGNENELLDKQMNESFCVLKK